MKKQKTQIVPKKKQSIIGYYKKYGWKAAGRDLLHDVIGSFLYALGISFFAENANFAPGGITGIAMIIHHYVPFLGIGLLSLIINIWMCQHEKESSNRIMLSPDIVFKIR